MSGVTAMGVLATAAAVGTAYTIYNGERVAGEQKKTQAITKESALANEKQAQKVQAQAREASIKSAGQVEDAVGKAASRAPDVASMLSGNTRASNQGGGGTMLTGPQGVDPAALNLGKTTLLGM